jgi:hypothetical protein
MVLDGHVLGNEFLAVFLLVVRAHFQLFGQVAVHHAVPVETGTAHAIAQQEGTMLAVRHGHVGERMTNRHGLAREVLEQRAAHRVFQFIDRLRIRRVGVGVTHVAAFQRQHVQAGFGELHAHDGAGPAQAHHHYIHFVFFDSHDQPFSPRIDTGPYGYFTLYWSTQSA